MYYAVIVNINTGMFSNSGDQAALKHATFFGYNLGVEVLIDRFNQATKRVDGCGCGACNNSTSDDLPHDVSPV